MPNESVWDFDQRFKMLKDRVSFEILDMTHKKWFISRLFPHIKASLMQQKVVSQSEAIDIAMRLEASPIRAFDIGVSQIQMQLAELTLKYMTRRKKKGDMKRLVY